MDQMLDELDLSQGQWEQVRSLARDRLERMCEVPRPPPAGIYNFGSG